MKVIQLDGLAPILYTLIGPLAMNPKVLKANNNYPFKTTQQHQWYICIEDEEVVGFIPVEKKTTGFVINNYYIKNDNEEVINLLLKEIKAYDRLSAVVLIKHEKNFINNGFKIEHQWTNYIKMTYEIRKHECKE